VMTGSVQQARNKANSRRLLDRRLLALLLLSFGYGGFVPRASHPAVASDARLGRVLVAEHQVVPALTPSSAAQTREGLCLLERLVRPKFMTLHERGS
jgi:hypothetical protein